MVINTEGSELLDKVNALRSENKSIAFVSGNFNIIHPGHMRLINFASECADYLIVGIYDDEREGVLVPLRQRVEGVKSLQSVNCVLPITDAKLGDYLRTINPDFVVKGKEYESKENMEQTILDEIGGRLIFSSGNAKYSSQELLRREFSGQGKNFLSYPEAYLKRHSINPRQLVDTIKSFSRLNVVVVGDLIVDEYVNCETLGLSQEDPTIVVTPVLSNKFIGGAGIVASHAASLGAKVDFFTVVGDDEEDKFAQEKLQEYKVNYNLFVDSSRPTTLKKRYRTKEKTLLRVSELRHHSIAEDLSEELFSKIKPKIDEAQLLIFSDFNYGCIPDRLLGKITSYARDKDILMVADSQSSSQVGDISRFRGMELISPTEREARLAMSDFQSGLVVLARDLQKKSESQNIFVTLGAEGVLIHSINAKEAEGTSEGFATDRLEALNQSPRDTAGAGDSLLVVSTMARAAGADIWSAAYLGSVASACQVGRVGNIPLTISELTGELLHSNAELGV